MRTCPSCQSRLQEDVPGGGIWTCSSCAGVVVRSDVTQVVLLERNGLTIRDLRDRLIDGIRAYPCPTCQQGMKSVVIHLDAIDVCVACGTLYLDKKEVSRILVEPIG